MSGWSKRSDILLTGNEPSGFQRNWGFTSASKALKDRGAKEVVAYCTHAVLSGPAISNIEKSQMDELVVTDTIPLSAEGAACGKIRQLSVAQLLAETVRRMAYGESVSSLYVD